MSRAVTEEEANSQPLIFKLRDALMDAVHEKLTNKIGRVFTVIDGAIADPEQRKAIKDLIRQTYWEHYDQRELWEIFEILWQFDKESGLHQINDSDKYRAFMDYPTKLSSPEDDVPRKKYFK